MPSVENEHVGDATLLLVDLEGDDRADTADTVAFLKQLCPEAGGRALELGVGLGRIAIPLVQAGVSVVGVELSEQIAAELVRRAAQLDLKGLHVVTADAATLDLGETFDVVYLPWNFLYFGLSAEAQRALLRVAYRHTSAGGSCVVETQLPDIPEGDESPDPMLGIGHLGEESLVLTFTSVRPSERRILRHRLVARANGVFFIPLTLRYATPDEVDELATDAGFSSVERLADWRGSPYDGGGRVISLLRRALV